MQSEEVQWEEIIPLDVEQGDLIWMDCMPGGLCIFLNKYPSQAPGGLDARPAEEYYDYRVYHATEGVLEMADYYFISLDEARRLGYTVSTLHGKGVANDWLTTPYGE